MQATGFDVVRSTTGELGPWGVINTQKIPVTTLTYTDTAVQAGATYHYNVYAYTDDPATTPPNKIISPTANIVCKTMAPTTTPAPAPTGAVTISRLEEDR